jgi:NAD-dependent dihydropyrimidine dehydrogenase PreA subunit
LISTIPEFKVLKSLSFIIIILKSVFKYSHGILLFILVTALFVNIFITVGNARDSALSETKCTLYAQIQSNECKYKDNQYCTDSSDTEQFYEFRQDNNSGCNQRCKEMVNKTFDWVLGVLGATMIAGILVRYKFTRNLRGVFLILSAALLGFYRGACPCPISSFEESFLSLTGVNIHWKNVIWFIGLIPITYFFGKVYCGWLCHLGALQEFIFIPGKMKFLQSKRSRKVLKGVRLLLLVILLIQLIVTKSLLFEKIDPFKVAFNLFSAGTTGWILLALLIITSVFIYRPFCRSACPIGMILGCILKIPGASVIKGNPCTTDCGSCETVCRIKAIRPAADKKTIDHFECNACGDCLSNCPDNAFSIK